jgi:hypothetical protein
MKVDPKKERIIGTTMALSLLGYVAVPRCPMIFGGTNYADFVAHIRVHMSGLHLWGVLCGDKPCSPRPIARVAPVPPMPPVIAADAFEGDRTATKTADDVAIDAYD